MEDRVIYKGGNHVISNNTEGRIKLIQPARGTINKFVRWWNRSGNKYIDCAIFLVQLNNGTAVRLVVPHTKGGMQVEIRHDGFGNFTFPKCHLERIAVVSTESTEVLIEYQFSKISGGSVLKRIVAGLPKPEVVVPEPEPTMQITVDPQPVIEVKAEPISEEPTETESTDEGEDKEEESAIIEVTTTIADLNKMTKKQLLQWASDLGYDLVDNHIKAQLLEECTEILEELS